MNVVNQAHPRAAMYSGYMPPPGPWALGMPVVPGNIVTNQTPMPEVQLPSHMTDMSQHAKAEGRRQQYKCDFCEYSSTKKENLARHRYLRGHGIVDSNGETQKCLKCDFRANASMLKEHMKSAHGDEMKQHKCHLCQYSSTRKENLTRHLKQHSRGK